MGAVNFGDFDHKPIAGGRLTLWSIYLWFCLCAHVCVCVSVCGCARARNTCNVFRICTVYSDVLCVFIVYWGGRACVCVFTNMVRMLAIICVHI